MLRLCSMYYRQSFELQSSVLAAHLAVIRGRSVAYTPMQTVRYQCGLASQFTQFTGPAVPATLHSCEAAARWHRMSDICLHLWRVTPVELEMEPGPATPAVRRRVQRQRLESRQRRRRLPMVASDRPSFWRTFFCCVVAE